MGSVVVQGCPPGHLCLVVKLLKAKVVLQVSEAASRIPTTEGEIGIFSTEDGRRQMEKAFVGHQGTSVDLCPFSVALQCLHSLRMLCAWALSKTCLLAAEAQ